MSSAATFVVPMRQTAFDALLRWALIGGALFDVAFGISAVFAWRWVLQMLKLELPPNGVYVQLAGVLTFGLALMILVGAIHPYRYHANITIAAIARVTNGALLFYCVRAGLVGRQILLLVAAEFILGILHFIYSRRLAVAASSHG